MSKKLILLSFLFLFFAYLLFSQWVELYQHVNRLRGFPALGLLHVEEENGRLFIQD